MEIRHARWKCAICDAVVDIPIEDYHGHHIDGAHAVSDDNLIAELQKPDTPLAPTCEQCVGGAMTFESFIHEKRG